MANTNDALLVMRYSPGLVSSIPDPVAADVDGSGTVNANDASKIRRCPVGVLSGL